MIRGGGIFVAPIPFFIGYVVNLLGDNKGYLNQVASIRSETDQRVVALWARLTGHVDDNIDFNNDFMPFRPTRMSLERSVSVFDTKHNFVANAVYRHHSKRAVTFSHTYWRISPCRPY